MVPRPVLLAGALFVVTISPAFAGDPQVGLALVSRFCSLCHSVGPTINPPNLAPPILDLAEKANGGKAWLRAWLQSPHPPIPDLRPSKQDVDDIAAYLAGLKPVMPH